ncbi:hypothetical protein FHG87_001609 [Trinorchestia longiramus]|nr:hypothetical protein FHG87_001609 [Trinorchestia longiramus]
MAGGKSKKAGPHDIIECMTCRTGVDLESSKGLTERNKLVFDCWKCMVDEKVKMADVNMKIKEEIERLKTEFVSLRRELEDERRRRYKE